MSEITGRTLAGRYRVEGLLGRGGMAEVYRVWDINRSVTLAMKLLREDLAQDAVFLRRFRREAQTLARLQHPNIVRFYGLAQDDLLAFMLMEYIEGASLRTEIFRRAGQPMQGDTILGYLRPICAALNYAHRQGMVHCDVKPANILIDKTGHVFVSDFGIARMTESATTTTMVGAGTPAYMSPEQARGENPTPQTDIYALGVMLFEMLTGGERPFTGDLAQTTGSTSEKVRWEQMNLRPPSPRRWNPQIAPEVEAVVLRCLDKESTRRYASTIDLLAALEKALALQPSYIPAPVPPEPPHPTPPNGRSPRRKQAMAVAFVLIGLIAVGILWLGLNLSHGFASPLFQTATSTLTSSPTPTHAATPTPTATATATATGTPTPTPSPTRTLMPTVTHTPTATYTPTATDTPSPSPTATRTRPTRTRTPTTPPTAIPTVLSPTPALSVIFKAKPATISPGQCATVHWEVSGVQAILYQDQWEVWAGDRTECPGSTTTYKLTVQLYSGEYRDYVVTVTVQ